MNSIKKAGLFLLLGFASLLPILAFAQVETERVELGNRNNVTYERFDEWERSSRWVH